MLRSILFTLLAVFCLASPQADSAVTGTKSYQCVRTPSGTCDTEHLDGNDGNLSLFWNTIANISITTTQCNAGYSVDLKTLYLNDPGSPSATIGWATGYSAPTGWSLNSSGVLSCSGTTTVNNLVKVAATRSGFVRLYPSEFRIQVVAAPSSDTTPPPYPINVSATGGTGQATISWDSTADNYESDGDAPTGTDHYEVCMDGGGCQNVPAGTLKAPQLTLTEIGSPSPAASITQTGNNWQFAGSGEIDGPDDVVSFLNVQTVADFTLSWQLTATTNNGASFPKFGGMARNTLAATSRFFSFHNQLGTTTQTRRRLTDSASTTGNTSNASTFPTFYRFTGSGSSMSAAISSDGNAFTAQATNYTGVTFDSTYYRGIFVVGATGTASTTTFYNLNISSGGLVTYIYNTTSGGSHTFTVRACDASSNCSAYSAGVTVSITAPADTTAPAISGSPSCSSGGQTQINCTCPTATDANGIRGYLPDFCGTSSTCSSHTDQAEQTSTSFSQTGLTASTTYYYRCRAADPSSNISSYSSIGNATTDTAGPPPLTAPTISSVSALSQTALRVTHTAVTGVDHYKYRESDTPGASKTIIASLDHATLTVDRTGLSASTQKCVEIAAANAGETEVVWSSEVCGTTSPITGGNAVKLRAGHYVEFTQRSWGTTQRNLLITLINQICPHPNVRGIRLRLYWYNYEQTANNYTAGFAMVDDILGLLSTNCPSRQINVMLGVETAKYGTSGVGTYPNSVYPSDFQSHTTLYPGSTSSWVVVANTTGWPGAVLAMAALWQTAVTDRAIAMAQAYGTRYNTNRRVEAWGGTQVSSQSPLNAQWSNYGFGWSAYSTQFRRYVESIKPYWANTLVYVPYEYGAGGTSGILNLVQHAIGIAGVAVGHNDPAWPLNSDGTWNSGATGARKAWSDSAFLGEYGTIANQKGLRPWLGGVQLAGYSCDVSYPCSPIAYIRLWYRDVLGACHISWQNNDAQSAAYDWTTNTLPFIDSNGTTCASLPNDTRITWDTAD